MQSMKMINKLYSAYENAKNPKFKAYWYSLIAYYSTKNEYLSSLSDEELCTKVEDDELLTPNMLKEAVKRLRNYSSVVHNLHKCGSGLRD